MVNLFRRFIADTDRCTVCNAQPEDILHAVWGCEALENVWSQLSWARSSVAIPPGDFSNLFAHFLQDFLNAQDPNPISTQLPTSVQWRPPEPNQYKANFDGAVFQSTNSAALGVVIRDWQGAVIGALSVRIPLPQTVAEVEILACCKAVSFALELSLREVVFEGDVVGVINAIKSGTAEHFSFGHIIDDIYHSSSHLNRCDFCFVNCSCNKVADPLAKKAKEGNDFKVWLEDISTDLAPLVASDVA
ncbi:uncharacterized protein LOC126719535 [Quercus robur]|uniref:uncharacterized protein LOC126719535 n=1 Tax=Quercus robur TaxID=38942 RepID=UPI00216298FD|nr:uncharacterized protein LOC126719535 [Quercus robur]